MNIERAYVKLYDDCYFIIVVDVINRDDNSLYRNRFSQPQMEANVVLANFVHE